MTKLKTSKLHSFMNITMVVGIYTIILMTLTKVFLRCASGEVLDDESPQNSLKDTVAGEISVTRTSRMSEEKFFEEVSEYEMPTTRKAFTSKRVNVHKNIRDMKLLLSKLAAKIEQLERVADRFEKGDILMFTFEKKFVNLM